MVDPIVAYLLLALAGRMPVEAADERRPRRATTRAATANGATGTARQVRPTNRKG